MTDAGFYRSMVTHRDRFLEIVLKPPNSNEASNLTSRFLTIEVADGSQYDMSQDYFRFMFEPGIEPTNNHSEQQGAPVCDRPPHDSGDAQRSGPALSPADVDRNRHLR